MERAGSRGTGPSSPGVALTEVLAGLADRHANVRRAATVALEPHAARPEIAEALVRASEDKDAVVRAFARLALAGSPS